MGRLIDITEIVGSFGQDSQARDVCATATGDFDDEASELRVTLDAFVRPADIRVRETRESAAWLPPRQLVREHVSRDEAGAVVREIFHRWAARVRAAVPASLQPHLH